MQAKNETETPARRIMDMHTVDRGWEELNFLLESTQWNFVKWTFKIIYSFFN